MGDVLLFVGQERVSCPAARRGSVTPPYNSTGAWLLPVKPSPLWKTQSRG